MIPFRDLCRFLLYLVAIVYATKYIDQTLHGDRRIRFVTFTETSCTDSFIISEVKMISISWQ